MAVSRLSLSTLACVLLLHAPALLAEAPTAPTLQTVVQLDKAAQRLFAIRTQRADTPAPLQAWPARAIADPRDASTVMAPQTGILVPPPGGFAVAGSEVQAGALLARLRPTLSEAERRDLEAERAVAERDVALGKLQIERYGINENEELAVRLLTPSMQIVVDHRAALVREAQLVRALDGEIELRAPAAGRILVSRARAGGIGEGERLFEIRTRNAIAVEAQVSDERFDAAAVRVAIDAQHAVRPLQLLSVSLDPQTRARRLLYALDEAGTPLSLGAPVQILGPRRVPTSDAFAVPVSAVFEEAGRSWVWIHRGAEDFATVPVTVLDRDVRSVRVRGELGADARIVINGSEVLRARRADARSA